MASIFNEKYFNAEVFGAYVDRVPDTTKNAFIEAGVINVRNDIKTRFDEQTGGNFATIPMIGTLSGDPDNYDGNTDITVGGIDTYAQSGIVKGTAKSFGERDFSYDITGGHDFMNDIAGQISGYRAKIDNKHMRSIVTGVFGVTTDNFSTKHTYDITGTSTGAITAVTDLDAAQQAAGDNADIFTGAIMNSAVATNLKKMEVLDFRKYTDANGIQREINLADWHGKTVVIADDDTVTYPNPTYGKTSDQAVVEGKTYYTRSGSSPNYVYTPVENPVDESLSSYYEVTGQGDPVYITYMLGRGAFDYVDCGAKTPYEPWRDPHSKGGISELMFRQRKLFMPRGFSFVMPTPAIISPTFDQLATAANWTVVTNAAGTKYFDTKAIPFARILSKG